jgi:hypothetical protein
MPKRIAVYALHYGATYLAWSIRSIQDFVDEIHVLYSPTPSHGHASTAACPETEEELKREADRFRTKPIVWTKGRWGSEGAQRDSIFPIAKERGATTVLVVDADELWDHETVGVALDELEGRPERIFRMPFVHFWKSFKWVCQDGAWPLRAYNLANAPSPAEGYLSRTKHPVYHFGYAIPDAIMRYKWLIHGHLAELRGGWLTSRYLPWKPGDKDVHPTCLNNYWEPKPTPPEMSAALKPLLEDHPYWGAEAIR